MNSCKKQLCLFFIAMGFLTRLRIPSWIDIDTESLNQASRYFGVVGLIVGGICASVFAITAFWLPVSIAIVLSMITSVVITGGFHEDGLADTADGFGGAWSAAEKLNIMKDPRLGSYGALALVFALLFKWQLLTEIALFDPNRVMIAFIIAHCLSRVLAASLIFSEKYVRDEKESKVKLLAQFQSVNELLILLLTAVLALFFLDLWQAMVLVLSLLMVRILLVAFFRGQIGGYTGDTLGAAQQVSELTCYFVLLTFGMPF